MAVLRAIPPEAVAGVLRARARRPRAPRGVQAGAVRGVCAGGGSPRAAGARAGLVPRRAEPGAARRGGPRGVAGAARAARRGAEACAPAAGRRALARAAPGLESLCVRGDTRGRLTARGCATRCALPRLRALEVRVWKGELQAALDALPAGLARLHLLGCREAFGRGVPRLAALTTLKLSNCPRGVDLGGLGELLALQELEVTGGGTSRRTSTPRPRARWARSRAAGAAAARLPGRGRPGGGRAGGPPALRVLDVSRCARVRAGPAELQRLPALRELDASFCGALDRLDRRGRGGRGGAAAAPHAAGAAGRRPAARPRRPAHGAGWAVSPVSPRGLDPADLARLSELAALDLRGQPLRDLGGLARARACAASPAVRRRGRGAARRADGPDGAGPDGCPVGDIAPLSELTRLEELDLAGALPAPVRAGARRHQPRAADAPRRAARAEAGRVRRRRPPSLGGPRGARGAVAARAAPRPAAPSGLLGALACMASLRRLNLTGSAALAAEAVPRLGELVPSLRHLSIMDVATSPARLRELLAEFRRDDVTVLCDYASLARAPRPQLLSAR